MSAWSNLPDGFSRSKLRKHGKVLANPDASSEERLDAQDFVDQWRAAHAYPLNSATTSLRAKARRTSSNAVIAQRLKRMPSITSKLQRGTINDLRTLQDVGGCRAILSSTGEVFDLYGRYKKSRKGVLETSVPERFDYIAVPKMDGYRGIHVTQVQQGGAHPEFSGLNIEVQLRTKKMHSWATALEIVDTFEKTGLKTSGGGTPTTPWGNFFLAASAAMALDEGCPTPGSGPSNRDEVSDWMREYDGAARLEKISGYSSTIKVLQPKVARGEHFILELDMPDQTIKLRRFSNFSDAERTYREQERLEPSLNTVLVSAGNLEVVKKAYPNYFADARLFAQSVRKYIRN